MVFRKCNPLYGWRWFSMGIRIFLSQPWPWLALVGLTLLFLFLLSTLPLLGMYGVFALFPSIAAGFLLAARAVMSQQAISFHHLTDGFKAAGRPLIAVGSLAFLIFFAALLLVVMSWHEQFQALIELLQSQKSDKEVLLLAGHQLMQPSLALLAVLLLLAIATWFAPALVLFLQTAPRDAMRLSFRACLANFPPFFVFCVLLILTDLAFSFLLRLLLGLLTQMLGEQTAGLAAMFFSFPIFCIFLSVLFAASYVSYQDVFETSVQNSSHINTEA